MVVHEDQRGGTDIEGLADHLARVDCGFVDRSFREQVVEDKAVRVEIGPHALMLRWAVDRKIVQQRLPAAAGRSALPRAMRRAARAAA